MFGYDLESLKRRTKIQVDAMGGRKPKDMPVVDNCPGCGEERTINLNQSRKNKPCSKCFHNTPEMTAVKLAQKGKQLTEEHKQHLKENHWSKHGFESAFKGKNHTKQAKVAITDHAITQWKDMTEEQKHELKKKESCTKRGIPLEDFDGFSAPEGTRIRQSAKGKAWTYDILSKANFTCVKCQERGGTLHAHHLNGFNSHPEQRFDLDNGACLCHDCHEEFHEVYGKGDNTKEQFEAWIML